VARPRRSESDGLRKALVSLLRESGADGEAPDARPLLDGAVERVSSTLERWSRGASLRRLLGGLAQDQLTTPGEWLALEAELGIAGRLAGKARFKLDDEVVAERDIGKGPRLLAMVRAPAPGVYRASVELDGVARELLGGALIHVAGARPLVFVDAELLLAADHSSASPADREVVALVRALGRAGFDVAYFDLAESSRDAAIRAALAGAKLGKAAILSYAIGDRGLDSLGLEFGEMFALAALGDLHARGVPVCAVVTERFARVEDRRALVSVLGLAAARDRLARDGLTHERERAEAFMVAWAEADRIEWRFDYGTASRARAGNAVVAELDNRRARERLFELIDGAARSIHFQVYIMRPSNFADELVVRLIARARAGVEVRVMVDALYSDQEILGRQNPLLQALEAEDNIEVVALSPIEGRRDIELTRLKRRDHRKLVIIDGRRALVSGRNADDEYYLGFDEVAIHDYTNHTRIPWLDAHVELGGPIVADIRRCFLDTWVAAGGGALSEADRAALCPPLEPVGDCRARFVVHEGLVDANGLAMYEALLELAHDHVYIVNDFPIVATLERAIERLLARGVRVELLTGNAAARRADGSLFPAPLYRTLFEHMVKDRIEPLMRAGVSVYEFQTRPSTHVVARGGCVRPYVHAKIMSIDGELCSVGSANLDATASFWESEANIVVRDRGFTRALEQQLRELIDASVALDPSSEYWQRERAQRAVVGKLWPGSLYS